MIFSMIRGNASILSTVMRMPAMLLHSNKIRQMIVRRRARDLSCTQRALLRALPSCGLLTPSIVAQAACGAA